MVSKATLLSSLEPLLSWSFADHTIPPAFRTQAEQVRPLALDLSMPVAIAGFVGASSFCWLGTAPPQWSGSCG